MKNTVLGMAMVAALATPALAQSINVDYGTFNPAPASTYGAAAALFATGPLGQGIGTWNNVLTGGGVTPALLGLNGLPTGVTLTGVSGAPPFSFNNGGTSGNDELLMDDGMDGTGTFTFSGLAAGTYEVFTYAWAPDSAAFITNVAVSGGTSSSLVMGDAAIGGAWPGTFVAGVTHAHHQVLNVAAGGSISITTTIGVSFATLDGIQIVLIPGPAGLAVLGLGLVAPRRRRN